MKMPLYRKPPQACPLCYKAIENAQWLTHDCKNDSKYFAVYSTNELEYNQMRYFNRVAYSQKFIDKWTGVNDANLTKWLEYREHSIFMSERFLAERLQRRRDDVEKREKKG